jgi:tRNA pseudouridine32 synthase / 23S rRNA pseudouridine746 synthase
MGISSYPSAVTMPPAEKPYPSILGFLSQRFPAVSAACWAQRMAAGRVLDEAARPLTPASAYVPGRRILYFREVPFEPVIPFAETILYQDDEILVACKPHFLPVTPGGRYVDECLLNRLRSSTGLQDLAPLHRIDRETAGIVLFSVNRKTRGRYGELFRQGRVAKSYEALSVCLSRPASSAWSVANRVAQGDPWFRMKVVPGPVNARSTIRLLAVKENRGRFLLQPLTGKTHQLRLHMSGLGFGIMNDRLYPELQPESADDFARPLQLLARRLSFRDPISGQDREFVSARELPW